MSNGFYVFWPGPGGVRGPPGSGPGAPVPSLGSSVPDPGTPGRKAGSPAPAAGSSWAKSGFQAQVHTAEPDACRCSCISAQAPPAITKDVSCNGGVRVRQQQPASSVAPGTNAVVPGSKELAGHCCLADPKLQHCEMDYNALCALSSRPAKDSSLRNGSDCL